ncbi:MAG: phosphoribosyl-ATP pyrophosphohydrolase/phosphoribosyl-AMP cyclohydrolase [Planctomycetota bacterium]|jgi:phosphoribosyl-ATP pyrophosphohydrolase/phosphoribosyl-AMP cyclohydrolase
MIIPSIDLERGRTVQLIGGEELAIDAGDPKPILDRFALAGEVAVVDLDAAKGEGSNAELMLELCGRARVRIGGGIRNLQTAQTWLNAGASKIVIGTAATPELLQQLPRERVIVALDSRDGEVVTHGWRNGTGRSVLDRVNQLQAYCGGFLITFVEREGRLGGTDHDRAKDIVKAAANARVTIAGGVTTPEEVAALDAIGADAQVGMALYANKLSLADAITAPLTSDRSDGLWPTVIVDARGVALGLAYSNRDSVRAAVDERSGIYHSRKRGLWTKGQSSGATQRLLAVDLDCDRDTLRFTVEQRGSGFCHLETRSCWGDDRGLSRLERRVTNRISNAPAGSNTARLLRDPALLRSKLIEEAGELANAVTRAEVRHESADLLYFALVKSVAAGVSLAEVEAELDMRERKVSRRSCEAKEQA